MRVEELVETCGGRLWKLCRKLAPGPLEAEDLYQQTFLRALEHEDRLDPAQNPAAWLCATAIGLWKSQARRYARRQRIAPQVGSEGLEAVPGGGDPEAALLTRERALRVDQLVDDLPEKLRQPVLLYYAAELPVEEIAKALGVPVGTVKSRLSRARERIRKGWEQWDS